MPNLKLTKSAVDSLPYKKQGQILYFDSNLKGFGLRVSQTTKSYIVQYDVGGRSRRVTIGRHGVFTAEEARRRAKELLAEMAQGVDPIQRKRTEREEAEVETLLQKAKAVTLSEVFDDYVRVRKTLKPRTIKDYRQVLKESFSDWLDRPLANITKDMALNRHAQRGRTSEARANNAMRVLRALFNFAAAQYEAPDGSSLFPENAVSRLTQTRAWYPNRRRQTVIDKSDLPAWFEAVMYLNSNHPSHKAEVIRDYLIFLLFTGLRRHEAAALKWSDVNLDMRTLTISDPKNRETFTVPIARFVHQLLTQRKEEANSVYVFPGGGQSGHIVEPRKQMAKVIESSGVTFTLHDLRRTYITIAESMDISVYALKRLINHKVHNDVTAGYIVLDVERLRDPVERISVRLLSLAGVGEKADVIAFQSESSNAKVDFS